MKPPRMIYLIVRNRDLYAMLWVAHAGLEGRIRQGLNHYHPADSDVFVLGTAAEHLPSGPLGMLEPQCLTYVSLLHTLRDDWPDGDFRAIPAAGPSGKPKPRRTPKPKPRPKPEPKDGDA